MSTPITRPSAPDLVPSNEHVVTRPGAEVEHGLAGLQGRVAGRHAAAQVQVGFGNPAGDTGIGVADHVQAVGRHLRAAAGRGAAARVLARDRAVPLPHQRPYLVLALHR